MLTNQGCNYRAGIRSSCLYLLILEIRFHEIEAAEETEDGSYFVAQEKGLRTQKQWLAFYAQSQGSIWVDKRAAEALSQHGKSLLLSGIVEAEGVFS